MSDWTYNTNHGMFLLKKENIPKAVKAIAEISSFVHEDDEFGQALSNFGLECTVDKNGNVIDISLSASNYSADIDNVMSAIAESVEPGSYLVFYGGGSDGCWALAYDGMIATGEDIEAVILSDLKTMLRALRAAGSPCYKEMVKRYPHVSESLLAAGLVVGARVRAKCTITEGGFDYRPDEAAVFPDKRYIHAKSGDTGTIIHVDPRDLPTVLFDRTGTSTITCEAEVEVIQGEPST